MQQINKLSIDVILEYEKPSFEFCKEKVNIELTEINVQTNEFLANSLLKTLEKK